VKTSRATISADVLRQPIKLLYSTAKLRSGAIGGDASDFVAPPHGSLDETYLVVIPAHAYPVILVVRKDYVFKPSGNVKIPVRIVRSRLGGYDLQSSITQGQYDSQYEFPIRP
jgi:hypothetical protein